MEVMREDIKIIGMKEDTDIYGKMEKDESLL